MTDVISRKRNLRLCISSIETVISIRCRNDEINRGTKDEDKMTTNRSCRDSAQKVCGKSLGTRLTQKEQFDTIQSNVTESISQSEALNKNRVIKRVKGCWVPTYQRERIIVSKIFLIMFLLLRRRYKQGIFKLSRKMPKQNERLQVIAIVQATRYDKKHTFDE